MTDLYLDSAGLDYLISQLDSRYSNTGGNVDLSDYVTNEELQEILANYTPSSGEVKGIKSVALVNYELIVTYTDDTFVNLGNIRGAKGQDGYTPIKGIDYFDGTNGIDGRDGINGVDGYSPTCTVTKDGTVATITCTDKNGTTTATISDGENGTGGGSSSSGEVYSTEPTAIGTWINGKTIYRKVITCNFTTNANSGTPVVESFSHGCTITQVIQYHLIKTSGQWNQIDSLGAYPAPLSNFTSYNNMKDYMISCSIAPSSVMIQHGSRTNGWKYYCILDYTTD